MEVFVIKRGFLIYSLFIIFIPIICVGDNVSVWIDSNYGSAKYNYDDNLLWIEIPKINFRDYVYNINNKYNDVKYHIQIIDYNIDNNYYVIAGHSGIGDKAYFNELGSIMLGDYVKIIINGKVLVYSVSNIYYIDKSGYIDIDVDVDSVYLVTCSNFYYNKQLVVRGSLLYGQF